MSFLYSIFLFLLISFLTASPPPSINTSTENNRFIIIEPVPVNGIFGAEPPQCITSLNNSTNSTSIAEYPIPEEIHQEYIQDGNTTVKNDEYFYEHYVGDIGSQEIGTENSPETEGLDSNVTVAKNSQLNNTNITATAAWIDDSYYQHSTNNTGQKSSTENIPITVTEALDSNVTVANNSQLNNSTVLLSPPESLFPTDLSGIVSAAPSRGMSPKGTRSVAVVDDDTMDDSSLSPTVVGFVTCIAVIFVISIIFLVLIRNRLRSRGDIFGDDNNSDMCLPLNECVDNETTVALVPLDERKE